MGKSNKKKSTLIPKLSGNRKQNIFTRKSICIVTDRIDIAGDLSRQIGFFGYNAQIIDTASELEYAVNRIISGVLIVDLDYFTKNRTFEKEIIQLAKSGGHHISVVFISENGDVDTRLRAVRTGGDAFFQIPVDINDLVDMLDMLTLESDEAPYRVLIVEDKLELGLYYSLLFQSSGIMPALLTNPMKIMKPLTDFQPELILMNMYMPGCSGQDLAMVIRQQQAFISIPIVFFSSEKNLGKQINAMKSGGDDFISKGSDPEYIIDTVRIKIQRYRILRSFMEKDSLTGLLKHSRIKEQLMTEVARAGRQNISLSYAMLDIDNFKNVNDTYGHLMGDRVLKSLSRLLQQRLRKSDIIGRYGGEEFAVILMGTGAEDALKIMDNIRKSFEQIRHKSEEGEFRVSFSCGIADFPRFRDAQELNELADKALYTAKEKGRNRVMSAHQLKFKTRQDGEK